MKTAGLLLIASLVSGSTVAPGSSSVVLHGRVTDASNGNALSGASVMVAGVTPGTQTDGQGTCELRFTPVSATARITVVVRRIGYATRSLPIDLAGRSNIVADFALTPANTHLSEVIITSAEGRHSARDRNAANAPFSIAPSSKVAGGTVYPGASIRRQSAPGNTEGYAVIDENPFFLTRERALSTFSVDVDRASYSNVRRFLNSGQRPPKDAVRIEELVNYFPYSYPEPRASDPVSISTSVASAPWNRSHRLVMIGLKARSIATAALPPNNLVFSDRRIRIDDVAGQAPPRKVRVRAARESAASAGPRFDCGVCGKCGVGTALDQREQQGRHSRCDYPSRGRRLDCRRCWPPTRLRRRQVELHAEWKQSRDSRDGRRFQRRRVERRRNGSPD